MTEFDIKKMKALVRSFPSKRILVIGDLMLDKYLWGKVGRISPEAPVPIVEVQRDTSCLGGAGNVSHNLESLGAKSILVGIVGRDAEGEWIKTKVGDRHGIITTEKRPTTVKTRIIAHQQQVVRVDQEQKHPISPALEAQIFAIVKKEHYEGILISDYNKGLLTRSLMKKILPFAQQKKVPVFVDPKIENFSLFSPVTLINPNHVEAEQIVHHPCLTNDQVEKAGHKILDKISARYLILKRGEQGLSVFEKDRAAYHIPTHAKDVFDVTGAGDTVIATAALALLSGANIRQAAFLANTAAGVVVGKFGTASLSIKELADALEI